MIRNRLSPAIGLALALLGCGAASSDQSNSAPLSSAPATTATLIFSASWSYGASVPLASGDLVNISYDAVRAESCVFDGDNGPLWATVAYYTYDSSPVQSVVIAGSGASENPSFSIPGGAGGDLAIWFETTNDLGCDLYDSNYGANFHFLVAAGDSTPPSWMGLADSVLTRADCSDEDSQCDSSRVALEQGFTFDTLARSQDIYTRLEFQVWQAGVTDFDNSNLWEELDVQMHWRIGGAGPYTDSYVSFDRYQGNNARYSFDLRAIDPLPTPSGGPLTDKSLCPAFATTISSDGQYIETPIDFWFTVNGEALRPASGGTYAGTYAQYAGLYAICST